MVLGSNIKRTDSLFRQSLQHAVISTVAWQQPKYSSLLCPSCWPAQIEARLTADALSFTVTDAAQMLTPVQRCTLNYTLHSKVARSLNSNQFLQHLLTLTLCSAADSVSQCERVWSFKRLPVSCCRCVQTPTKQDDEDTTRIWFHRLPVTTPLALSFRNQVTDAKAGSKPETSNHTSTHTHRLTHTKHIIKM